MLISGFRVATRVLEGRNFCLVRKNIYKPFSKFVSTSNMVKKALVFLCPGTEEMEFVIIADILRRGGVDVTVAGIPDASSTIKCSRETNIKPDIGVNDAASKGPYDVVVLPGGLGGSKALAESAVVGSILKDQERSGRLIAAICAASTALKAHGIAVGKTLTSFPAMRDQMEEGGKYKYSEDNVVVDGNLITSRAPGTAFQFALKLVEDLEGKEKANSIAKAMLLNCA